MKDPLDHQGIERESGDRTGGLGVLLGRAKQLETIPSS